MPHTNLLEDVANDLALWIDDISTDIALAFSATRSPFSAHVTEEEKLEFYKSRLFNPDGSPNAQGRDEELARMGSDSFAQVFKAVTRRWPELKPMAPPEIGVPDQWPSAPPAGPLGAPGGPPGLAGPMSLPPGGPLMPPGGPGPGPRPPMMPLPGAR